MAQPVVIQGSDEEIAAQRTRFKGRRDLLLIVPDVPTSPVPPEAAPAPRRDTDLPVGVDPNHFYFTATPEEFQKALDDLAEMNRDLPVLPPEAFSRENLYAERV